VDRFFRSWDLVMKSFGVLMSDKELLVFPISSAIGCVTVSVWIGSVFAFTYPQQLSALAEAGPHRPALTQEMWICLFFLYLANYFIVVFFNVGLVCAASDRLAGGHASINQGLQVAWARKGKIFQWALVAATFGILMNMVEKRAGWLGRLIARMIGVEFGDLFCCSASCRGGHRAGRCIPSFGGFIQTNLGRRSGWRIQLWADLCDALNSGHRVAVLPGPRVWTNGGYGWICDDGRLLASSFRHQLRSARHFHGGALPVRHDKEGFGHLRAWRFLLSLAAEAISD